MTAVRQQAIEAGARALRIIWAEGLINGNDDLAAAVVDAVEPIIRADAEDFFASVAVPNIVAEVRERIAQEIEAEADGEARLGSNYTNTAATLRRAARIARGPDDVIHVTPGRPIEPPPSSHSESSAAPVGSAGTTTPTTVSTDVRDSIWRNVR